MNLMIIIIVRVYRAAVRGNQTTAFAIISWHIPRKGMEL